MVEANLLISEKFLVRLKKEINRSELFLALPYSLNLKIMIAQDTMEKMSKSSMANLLTGVALERREINFELGFMFWDNKSVVSNMFSIHLYLP